VPGAQEARIGGFGPPSLGGVVNPAALIPSASRWGAGLAGAVVDALPLGVIVVDGEGEVLVANPAAEEMASLTDGGRLSVRELHDLVRTCLEGTDPVEAEIALPVPIEAPLRRPRRDREQPLVRVRALEVGPGVVLLLLEDLTEQRRVDAVRRDFVANVSHELKTPVGAMHLLAEAITESSDDEETVRRFAGRMATESRRLGDLVQELIDLSRLQGAEPLVEVDDLPVSALVAEAVDRVRTVANAKEIEIATIGEEGLHLSGDRRQLVMAVSNLLDNAVTYSPPRTRVVVGLRRHGSGWIEITVRDEGIGISAPHQERIFERFFRVDPARSRLTGGTGLGLAIVKHVATNHGGSIAVWSAEGAGSTFTLTLPTTPPTATTAAPRRLL
jgi:two-component system sensor histidine kinase SenX3